MPKTGGVGDLSSKLKRNVLTQSVLVKLLYCKNNWDKKCSTAEWRACKAQQGGPHKPLSCVEGVPEPEWHLCVHMHLLQHLQNCAGLQTLFYVLCQLLHCCLHLQVPEA